MGSCAGVFIRAIALLIDKIFLIIFLFILEKATRIPFLTVIKSFASDESDAKINTPDLMIILFCCVLSFVYFSGFVASKFQATPGKICLGICVISTEGNGKVSILQAIFREIMTFFSAYSILGYVVAVFTKEKITLHDFVCRTRVIKGEPVHRHIQKSESKSAAAVKSAFKPTPPPARKVPEPLDW